MPENSQTPSNPALTGIRDLCPRCQRGLLFVGLLKLAPRCDACGLDYSFADPADGPAFFAMTIVAVPALAFALWFQFAYEPRLRMHVFVTVPLTLMGSLLLLRPLKGWLVCSQYFYKAEQGSIALEWDNTHQDRPSKES
ncbi:DUF983 domain-containing protein [Pararhizobium sp. DWP3-4]|uniref:DUF983 domain-containing protein n=1 Tax=Pararhizobium sp. DWP3-4 TaxID=2804565 RepID=UPI003CEF90F9